MEFRKDDMTKKKNELEFESENVKAYVQQIQAENGILAQQLDLLKAENKELKEELEELKEENEYNEANAIEFKQTLAEIKEIVKPHQRNIDKICGHCRRYDGCHACCIDDINCYQYKKPTTPACDKYCELKEFEINNIANQILQKISECEGNDA